jgi:hypothetical protein
MIWFGTREKRWIFPPLLWTFLPNPLSFLRLCTCLRASTVLWLAVRRRIRIALRLPLPVGVAVALKSCVVAAMTASARPEMCGKQIKLIKPLCVFVWVA